MDPEVVDFSKFYINSAKSVQMKQSAISELPKSRLTKRVKILVGLFVLLTIIQITIFIYQWFATRTPGFDKTKPVPLPQVQRR